MSGLGLLPCKLTPEPDPNLTYQLDFLALKDRW